MARLTPRQIYAAKIRLAIFGDDYHGTRSPTWIADKLGVSVNTVRAWRKDPGRIPAWQYLRIMQIIKD